MEVIDPALTVKVTGPFIFGLKSFILNKIKDTVSGIKSFIHIFINMFVKALYYLFYLFLSRLIINLFKKQFILNYFYFKKSNNFSYSQFNYSLPKVTFPCSSIKNKRSTLGRPISKILYYKCSFHTWSRAINRIGPHNTDVISVIIGLLLGDGYASNRSGEGVRISIKQSSVHKEYLFFLYHFFLVRGYCSNLEPRKYSRTIKGIDKVYSGYEFNTYTFRSFVWIYDLFYNKGKKVVPLNLEQYFTPLTLAILISDDGGYTNAGVRIATNSFSLIEVKYLATILNNKFNLDTTIQKIGLKDKYSLYIKKNSMDKLRSLILSHIHFSMYYKLGIKSE